MTLDAVDLNIYLFFSLFAAAKLSSLDALTTVSLLDGCAREKSSSTLAPVPESYRQTDRHTDIQTDRQTDKTTFYLSECLLIATNSYLLCCQISCWYTVIVAKSQVV